MEPNSFLKFSDGVEIPASPFLFIDSFSPDFEKKLPELQTDEILPTEDCPHLKYSIGKQTDRRPSFKEYFLSKGSENVLVRVFEFSNPRNILCDVICPKTLQISLFLNFLIADMDFSPPDSKYLYVVFKDDDFDFPKLLSDSDEISDFHTSTKKSFDFYLYLLDKQIEEDVNNYQVIFVKLFSIKFQAIYESYMFLGDYFTENSIFDCLPEEYDPKIYKMVIVYNHLITGPVLQIFHNINTSVFIFPKDFELDEEFQIVYYARLMDHSASYHATDEPGMIPIKKKEKVSEFKKRLVSDFAISESIVKLISFAVGNPSPSSSYFLRKLTNDDIIYDKFECEFENFQKQLVFFIPYQTSHQNMNSAGIYSYHRNDNQSVKILN